MPEFNLKLPASLQQFSSIFKKKEKKMIGVDIGSNSIKIVELERKKKEIALKNYAISKTESSLIETKNPGILSSFTGEILREIFEKAEIKERKINVALPSFTALTLLLKLETENEEELEQQIQLEAAKYVPVPLTEVVFDWQLVNEKDSIQSSFGHKKTDSSLRGQDLTQKGKKQTGKETRKVVLVAVMKEISQRYEEILGKSGFQINALEVDAFSLTRSLAPNNQESYIILDIGEKVSNLAGVYKGNLVLNKSIDVAGSRFSRVIARALNISQQRAEQMKIKQGINIKPESLRQQVMHPLLDTIAGEIEKMSSTMSSEFSTKFQAVILSGGTSRMMGFKEYLEQKLERKVLRGNPWSLVTYLPQIEKTLLSLSPNFGTAVGLAMLGLRE